MGQRRAIDQADNQGDAEQEGHGQPCETGEEEDEGCAGERDAIPIALRRTPFLRRRDERLSHRSVRK